MSKVKLSIRILPLLALASALSGASLACTANIPIMGRTITPTPTVTPTVTDTPTATRTFTPSKTPTALPTELDLVWPVIFYDTFEDNRNGWLAGNFNDAWSKGTISVAGGKYRVSLTARQPVIYISTPGLRSLKDFYLAVDVQKTTGYTDANYGLFFRIADESGYYFSLDADEKKYGVDLLLKNQWVTKKDPSSSGKINYDGSNRIAVLAEGSHFVFFINGQEVYSMTDASVPSGQAGVALILFTVGDTVDIEFDNFEVRAPAD